MIDRIPDRVGPYRLQSRLGAGGMGEVFLALDESGRTVAVKLLHPGSDEDAHARLVREAATMRQVRGPHVAEVIDTGRLGDRPYVVTRYIQGRPLDAVVRDDGPLTGAALWRVARGLARALAAIHGAGVVHRDLKPGNVMLVEGEPVLIDFGIAYAAASSQVTDSGIVIGTAGYVAPEVLRGDRAGRAADIFAWSATLVYAATGRSAFGTGSMEQIFFRVLNQEPDLTGVPAGLRRAVSAGLAGDPAVRPDAAGLLALLGGTGDDTGSGETIVAAAPPASAADDGTAPTKAIRNPTAAGTAASGTARSGSGTAAGSRSHAARRREERMRRIRARRDEPARPSPRATWWLACGAIIFAAGMGAADDHISGRARLLAHAAFLALMGLSFAVSWTIRRRAGASGALWRPAVRFGLAAACGSGAAVLLAWLVSSAMMTFVLGLVAVLALATLFLG